VLEACDRVVVLERGRVARVGPPGEILASAKGRAGRGGLQAVQ
jgi:ABC-type sulfate/molybdate transport systems ATPase subunit